MVVADSEGLGFSDSDFEKCPACERETLLVLTKCRSNHPFGRNSRTVCVPVKLVERCIHTTLGKNNHIIGRCGYEYKEDLRWKR